MGLSDAIASEDLFISAKDKILKHI